MKETFRIHFPLAILAGLCISIGCTVNMKVGGVAGAVLFAFGLTTVVYTLVRPALSAVRATGVCCSSCLWATLWVAF